MEVLTWRRVIGSKGARGCSHCERYAARCFEQDHDIASWDLTESKIEYHFHDVAACILSRYSPNCRSLQERSFADCLWVRVQWPYYPGSYETTPSSALWR